MAEVRDTSSTDADPWLTPEQVGEELQVHPATVRLWIRTGRLRATRVGRSWRVRRSEIDRVLASGASPARTERVGEDRPSAETHDSRSRAPRKLADRIMTVAPLPDRSS
jgi:excisionase family DNA binding protein